MSTFLKRSRYNFDSSIVLIDKLQSSSNNNFKITKKNEISNTILICKTLKDFLKIYDRNTETFYPFGNLFFENNNSLNFAYWDINNNSFDDAKLPITIKTISHIKHDIYNAFYTFLQTVIKCNNTSLKSIQILKKQLEPLNKKIINWIQTLNENPESNMRWENIWPAFLIQLIWNSVPTEIPEKTFQANSYKFITKTNNFLTKTGGIGFASNSLPKETEYGDDIFIVIKITRKRLKLTEKNKSNINQILAWIQFIIKYNNTIILSDLLKLITTLYEKHSDLLLNNTPQKLKIIMEITQRGIKKKGFQNTKLLPEI